ncbi:MAG: 4Fe-4S dicluster domain-containing protein [Elusimicrobia bacterium]|nr:4Fe-4S dicluster domain-containing protein [Elusimicrobiota bacterium]
MILPKLRELKEAITAIFSRRYTTKFPAEPHEPAEGFRGKPVPDDKWCIGCEACSEVCPAGAIEIEDDRKNNKRIIRRLYDRCIYCGQCELECPQPKPGVVLTKEYDFADFTKDSMRCVQEFELITCGKCGCTVGTVDQLLATARRIGPALASAGPEMILVRQNEIGAPGPQVRRRKEDTRSDIMVFLCPSCRHKVYTTEAGK